MIACQVAIKTIKFTRKLLIRRNNKWMKPLFFIFYTFNLRDSLNTFENAIDNNSGRLKESIKRVFGLFLDVRSITVQNVHFLPFQKWLLLIWTHLRNQWFKLFLRDGSHYRRRYSLRYMNSKHILNSWTTGIFEYFSKRN